MKKRTDNVFDKPNEQNEARFNSAMARKRRMKSNVFVKPNEQSQAGLSYAMARKRRMKSNVAAVLIALFAVAQVVILYVCGYTPYPDSDGYISLASECLQLKDAYPAAKLICDYPFLWNLGPINAAEFSLALTGSIFPLLLFYTLLKAIMTVFFYSLAKKLCGQQVAFIALIIYLIYPANYGEGTSALSELPFMFFTIAGIHLSVVEKQTAFAGALLAVANYFRPMAIVFLVAMAFYYFSEWRKSARLAVGFVATIAVIGLAHKAQSGLFLFQAKTGWMALADYSTGSDPQSMAIRGRHDLDVAQKDSAWRALTLEWIRQHPGEYVAQMPRKLVDTYASDNVNLCTFLPDKHERKYMYEPLSMRSLVRDFPRLTPVQWLAVMNLLIYYTLLLLALLSLRHYRHSTHALPTAVVVAGTALLLVAGHGEARFHIPFMPFIILLAAYQLTRIKELKILNTYA